MFKSLGNPEEKMFCGVCIGCFHESFMKLFLFSYMKLNVFFLRMKKKKNPENSAEMLKIFATNFSIVYVMD